MRCRGVGGLVAEEPVDAAEQEQLPLAFGTAAHVGEQGCVVAVVEEVRQPRPGFLVPHRDSSPRRVASRFRPRRFQLLTEPSGTCSWLAIALSLKSP